jgi:protein-tyrosine phosphatase
MFKGKFQYKVLNVLDSPSQDLYRYFNEVVNWMASVIKSGGTVFVHCWAGVSRSSTFVIAYLMKEMGLSLV